MAKHTAPMVEIELDKTRHLKVDFNALALAEEVTGVNVLNKEIWANPSARVLRGLLWAFLVHEDEGLTIEQAGEFLDFDNIDVVSQKLVDAFTKAMPEADDSVPLAQEKAKNSTG